VLGFTIPQLNRPIGESEVNQLAAFESLALFAPTIAGPSQTRASKPDAETNQRRKSRTFPRESRRTFEDLPPTSQETGPKTTSRLPGDRDSPETYRGAVVGRGTKNAAPPDPDSIPLVAGRLPDLPENLPMMVNPLDSNAPLELRVRSYLHTNCAHCHRDRGGGNSKLRLRLAHSVDQMNVMEVPPEHGDLRLDGALIVTPGDPQRSILLERMRRRGRHQMPPLGSQLPDTAAVELIEAWISAQQP
jgi:hypothetical protein